MGPSDAQKKATAKYHAKFDNLNLRITKGDREKIKAHADKQGESLSQFVQRAIRETMERDNSRGDS